MAVDLNPGAIVNEQAKHVIGAVDIGGTKIAVGIIDGDGKVLARLECPTDADLGYSHALGNITDMLRTPQGWQIRRSPASG